MRRIEKLPGLPARSEWELATAFVQRNLWPHLLERRGGIDAHYHATEEQLQVVRGSMTFVAGATPSSEEVHAETGERLRIPEGTVHSVTIGSEGVTYVMGMARPIPLEQFPVYLPITGEAPPDVLADLVEANYRLAEAEEIGVEAENFFDNLLSDQFVFVTADDRTMRKRDFIDGLDQRKGHGRRSTGLQLRCDGSVVAASIIVTTADQREYLNIRLFQKEEDGRCRCVRWSNAEIRPPSY